MASKSSIPRHHRSRAAAEPHSAGYQRDLSVAYNKIGDVQRALGQGQAARKAYERSLTIAEQLAADEPHRAQSQRDLSVPTQESRCCWRRKGGRTRRWSCSART
jgi:hypothetical protein